MKEYLYERKFYEKMKKNTKYSACHRNGRPLQCFTYFNSD